MEGQPRCGRRRRYGPVLVDGVRCASAETTAAAREAAQAKSWRWAGGGFRRASKAGVARGILLRSLREATPTHTSGVPGRVLCVRGWVTARLFCCVLYAIDDRSKRRRIIRNTLFEHLHTVEPAPRSSGIDY